MFYGGKWFSLIMHKTLRENLTTDILLSFEHKDRVHRIQGFFHVLQIKLIFNRCKIWFPPQIYIALIGYRTVLAYTASGHHTRVNYYSNPEILYSVTDTPTGKSQDKLLSVTVETALNKKVSKGCSGITSPSVLSRYPSIFYIQIYAMTGNLAGF